MKTFQQIYKQLILENRITEGYKTVDKYTTDTKTSKMWIRPDGEVINLSVWHHDYILKNAKALKIKIKRKGEDVRLDAIDAGWFRVNYVQSSGEMVIEGKRKFFNQNIKDAVFGLIHKNRRNIWIVSINLLDDQYRAVGQGTTQLFQYDDSEKMEHIPFITESIRRKYGKS